MAPTEVNAVGGRGIRRHRGRSGRLRAAVAAAMVALLACAALWPVTHAGFSRFDDDAYVTENQGVIHGITARGVAWAFTDIGHGANWHPLTWLSHQLDVTLYGLSPGGHHFTSLLLHAGAAALLLLVLNTMTGALAPSALAAALFALHPIHVESVAWVAERKDVLSGLLGVLLIGAWLRYARRPAPARYLAALCVFAAGLLAKPMLVTFPLVLLLLDWWPLGRCARIGAPPAGESGGPPAARRLVLEKIPLLLLSAASALVTVRAQAAGGGMGILAEMPFWLRLENALVSLGVYLGKTVWPTGLAVFYPHPGSALAAWKPIAAAAFLATATALVVRGWRRRPALLTGWLWYLVTIAPVLGLVQVGGQGLADRYTYLPLVGIFAAAAWQLADLARGRPRARSVAAAAVVLLLLASLAHRQASLWRDDFTLFGHAARVTRGNWLAHNMVGTILMERGDPAGAATHFEAALRAQPERVKARYNLGGALMAVGKHERAVAEYRRVLARDPSFAEAANNLGAALYFLGRPSEAADAWRTALRIRPGFPDAQRNLGLVEGRQPAPVRHGARVSD